MIILMPFRWFKNKNIGTGFILISLFLLIALVLAVLLVQQQTNFLPKASTLFADKPNNAYLFLYPNKRKIMEDEAFSVEVEINTKNNKINAVSAFLSYPKDLLEVNWIKSTDSSFEITAEETFGEGIIKITRGQVGEIGGNARIATIGFKAKSAGEAKVEFITGSAAPRSSDSSDALRLSDSRGGNYQIVARK